MKYNTIYTSILIFLFVTSCVDEDLAMLGAVATGAAANYAGANGDAATAASLLDTQQQIMNEEANTAAANASSAANTVTYVTASPVPGKPGFAISPHSGNAVNVEGIPAGTLVEDPTYANGRFRVPASNGQIPVTTNTGATDSNSIAGNWSNAKLTWNLGADGNATLVVPSSNSNGVATTYMTYTTQAGTLSYNISHSTFTGGISDIDQPVNKSYTENYTLSGNTLTVGTEVMTR